MILWIIQSNHISFYFLLIPFSIRFYLLYELLEFLIILLDKNKNKQIYKIRKQELYHNLTLFYLIHTGFLTFINLYIWSNNFQFSTEFFLNMDYFIPQWIRKIHTHSSLPYVQNIQDLILKISFFSF